MYAFLSWTKPENNFPGILHFVDSFGILPISCQPELNFQNEGAYNF